MSDVLVDPESIALTRDRADETGAAVVSGLMAAGIQPGSMIAFAAPNSPQLLAAIFGCLRGGYSPLILSAALTPSERSAMLATMQPSLLVDEERCAALAIPVPAEADRAQLDDYFHCRPLHFTSGTSGHPKAVWSGWLTKDLAEQARADEERIWRFAASDLHLVCAPLSHSAPLRFALYTLLAGGTVYVLPRFQAADAAALIARERITTTFMAPAHLQRLLAQAPPERSSLRLLAHAGSACAANVKESAIATFGERAVVEFYGSTEGQFTVCSAAEWRQRPTTVGKARPGRELKVVDGAIWCRAPEYARFEYWGAPAKTAAAWNGDWFTVADLGRLDADGYLYLDGRRDDLIISGGVNVYPAEVERILGEAPGVEKICVVGVPDERWGARVCAAVVGGVTETGLRAYANTHLAPYKRPKTIVIADTLPLTHSGKIDRSRVARLLP